MKTNTVKPTARRIKAFGVTYTVQAECESGFIVHDIHHAGHVHEVLIFRGDAEILVAS
jgi:hypothetical protein